jgi:Ras-related protein Rab-6A
LYLKMSTGNIGGEGGTEKLKFKIVFLGNQSVGKTSMIHRFIYDSFDDNYQATIGIDFMSQKVYVEDKIIVLNLWDTAGQERFKSLIPSYIKDSAVAIVCFDVTSRDSFNSVGKWIEDARALREDDVMLILAGNKADLSEHRQVSEKEARELADNLNLMFFETSAKTGLNIKTMFNEMAKKLTGIETNPISGTEEPVA